MWGRDQQFHSVFYLEIYENTFYLFIYLFIYYIILFHFSGNCFKFYKIIIHCGAQCIWCTVAVSYLVRFIAGGLGLGTK